MSKVNRLDIKALVALVDEDELRKVLDEGVYYWYVYYPQHDQREYSTSINRFKTKGNPLEYLIFNEDDFTSALLQILPRLFDEVEEEIEENRIDEQFACVSDILLNEPTKYPEYAEIVWKQLLNIKIQEFLQHIYDAHEGEAEGDVEICLHLLNSDLEYILPASNNVANNYYFAKAYLKQWGMKE